MKKIVIVFFISLLFSSCEWFKVDVLDYLDYYTNSAAIDNYTIDSVSITNPSGVASIPSSNGNRILHFSLRNPQAYTLTPTITWKDTSLKNDKGSTPTLTDDYTITQISPHTIELVLTESFITFLDNHPNVDNVSATIALKDVASGRFFESYTYSLYLNTVPPQPEINLKGAEDSQAAGVDRWYLSIGLSNTDEAKHQDIKAIRINGIDYPVTVDSSGKATLGEKPSSLGLEAEDDEAEVGELFNFKTDIALNANPSYTIYVVDDKNITSDALIVTKDGIKGRTEFYVSDTNASDSAFGSKGSPYESVQRAVTEILKDNDGVTNYTIYVDGDITEEGSDTLGSDEALVEIESSKALNITINGLNSSNKGIINAEDSKRALYISGAGANVTLGENLTITGGNADNGAGVLVENNAKLVLNGVIIENNNAITGGGITIGDSTLTMKSGTIQNNHVVNSGGSVSAQGGGISVFGNSTVYLSGGEIKENTGFNGGGIFATDSSINFYISGSPKVYDNLQVKDGTIKNNFHFLNDENTSIISLNDKLEDGANIGLNPVLTDIGSELVLGNGHLQSADSGKFSLDNESLPGSPQIFNENLIIFDTLSYVYLSSGGDNNNMGLEPELPVKDFATAISRLGESGTIYITGTVNVSTNEEWDGGDNIIVERYDDYKGSLINLTGGTLTLKNITIDGQGGGTKDKENNNLFNGEGNITASAPLIQQTGGTLLLDEKSFLQNNNAGSTALGGAIYSSAAVQMTGGVIQGNNANEGAGVYIAAGGTLTVNSGSIKQNVALNNGGGVAVVGSEASFTMSAGYVSQNIAKNYRGGGVFVDDAAKFTLSGTATINSNSTLNADNGYGGGVAVYDGSTFEMKDSEAENLPSISNNTAAHSGAGVLLAIDASSDLPPSFSMSAGLISNNTATNYGGGVGIVGKASNKEEYTTFSMTGGEIKGNTATGHSGGGVFADDGAKFTLSGNSIITSNNAPNTTSGLGGGVAIYDGSSFTMEADGSNKSPTISDNDAGNLGGGVSLYTNAGSSAPSFTMKAGDIRENEAGDHAGGVNVHSGTFTMEDGYIRANTSENNAAGVLVGHHIDGNLDPNTPPEAVATFTMTGGEISANSVPVGYIGGGVYLEANGELKLSRSPIIKDNGAGGVLVDEGNDLIGLSGETPNNILFSNAYANYSNIKIIGDLTLLGSNPQIGLSPQVKTAGSILVQNEATYAFDEKYFFMDDNVSFAYKDNNHAKIFASANIYLDGEDGGDGNDTNRGDDPNLPVKTFETALARLSDTSSSAIWIKGTVTVNDGEHTWEPPANWISDTLMIKRYNEFINRLVTIDAGQLTLKNIIFDGGSVRTGDDFTNPVDESLIVVGTYYGNEVGKLILSDGSIIRNNNNTNGSDGGGGVFVERYGYLHLDGGRIENNRSFTPGGGVYLDRTKEGPNSSKFSRGSIANNFTNSRGGGIYSYYSNFTIEGDFSVTGNKSTRDDTVGGGIDLSDSTLTMTGGSITNNSAKNSTGGINAFNGSEIHLSGNPVINNNENGNIFFLNSQDSSPVKIVGELREGASIGLSPNVTSIGAFVVQGAIPEGGTKIYEPTISDALKFSHDGETFTFVKNGNNIALLSIGVKGPGGGTVFYVDYTGAYKEALVIDSSNSDLTNASVSLQSAYEAVNGKVITVDVSGLTLVSSTDWFIPNKHELNEIYEAMSSNDVLEAAIAKNIYWSTTSADFIAESNKQTGFFPNETSKYNSETTDVWTQNFHDGSENKVTIGGNNKVIAIRTHNPISYTLGGFGPGGGRIFWVGANNAYREVSVELYQVKNWSETITAAKNHSTTKNGQEFTDWYIPDIFELNGVYVNSSATNMSGETNVLPSFSEMDNNNIWGNNFRDTMKPLQESVFKYGKDSLFYDLRAIRAFNSSSL